MIAPTSQVNATRSTLTSSTVGMIEMARKSALSLSCLPPACARTSSRASSHPSTTGALEPLITVSSESHRALKARWSLASWLVRAIVSANHATTLTSEICCCCTARVKIPRKPGANTQMTP